MELSPLEKDLLINMVSFQIAIDRLSKATDQNKEQLVIEIGLKAMEQANRMPHSLINELIKKPRNYD